MGQETAAVKERQVSELKSIRFPLTGCGAAEPQIVSWSDKGGKSILTSYSHRALNIAVPPFQMLVLD